MSKLKPYPPEQLQKDALALARAGEWIPLRDTLVWGVFGIIFGSWGADWMNNGGVTLLFTVLFGAYGFWRGHSKARILRVQSYTALRVLELERKCETAFTP